MSVRQRIPFKFSEDDGEDSRILDEQEQEELIENLRKQSDNKSVQYLLFLQITLALSCILHYVFLLQQPKRSPLAALLPNSMNESVATIPLPVLFALVHILVHLNLALSLLSPSHQFRRTLVSFPAPLRVLPLASSSHVLIGAASIAPITSLVFQCGWADIVWWAMTLLMIGIVTLAKSWMAQNDESIKELERMRYDARGA